MNYKIVLAALGRILLLIGGTMLVPLIISYKEIEMDTAAFTISAMITLISGATLYLAFRQARGNLGIKEGLWLVTITWFAASFFGALPFALSGYYPELGDALLEAASGFTATGINVLPSVEVLPESMLLWRSMTQWLGGMGIVVLFVAILSSLGVSGMQLFKAEFGQMKEKISPRISDNAKRLWYAYVSLTLLNALALKICGLGWFDAINHAMTTIATGGYSTMDASFGGLQNPAAEWVTIVFMFIGGMNFILIYRIFAKRSIKLAFKSLEFRLYVSIIAIATLLSFVYLALYHVNGAGTAFRYALFSVVSVITTTGYTNDNFLHWPFFTQYILLILMVIGGCSGSTSGGMKVERILIMLKQTQNELQRIIHPRVVTSIKVGDTALPTRVATNAGIFFFLYVSFLLVGTMINSFFDVSHMEALSMSATCIGNGGAFFSEPGGYTCFSDLASPLKYYDAVLMIIGRLEIYTFLVTILPISHKHGERIDKVTKRADI
ncbi:TrkH family potassium uptake protein [Peptococcus simiae]|uniref:TrkH family potassium uptake protein n=1 Tax=Peptococcus simiae TaxID=1643805 RepID=UPI0039803CA4